MARRDLLRRGVSRRLLGLAVGMLQVQLLLTGGVRPARGQAAASFSVDDVRRAWAARQERVPTLRLVWETREFTPKGGLERGQMRGKTVVRPPNPPMDRDVKYSRSLLVDRGRMRFIERGDYWDDEDKCYAPTQYTNVWDGKEGRGLDQLLDKSDHWSGRIVSRTAEVLLETSLVPQVAMWPLDPILSAVKIEDYQATDHRAEIDGESCILLRKVAGHEYLNELWVDPARDYLIVRMNTCEGSFVRERIEIKYQRDAEHGYYPAEWREVLMNSPERLCTTRESKASEHTFTPELEPSDFQLEFPADTMVTDKRGSEYTRYLVLPDGNKRLVLEEEWEAFVPRKTLMETEPGEPLRPQASRWPWMLLFSVVPVAVILLAVLRRRFARRTS